MKLREKREQWGNGKRYVGRKNNYKVTVSYAPSDFTGKKIIGILTSTRKIIVIIHFGIIYIIKHRTSVWRLLKRK